jgi:hypothetical protein
MESGSTLSPTGLPPVQIIRLRFDQLIVKPEGAGYAAVATVDAEGRAGDLAVSYLGLERIPFERREGKLLPAGELLPALSEILATLGARLDAFKRRDASAYESLIAERYEDPRITRRALIERVRDDFEHAIGLSLLVTNWTIRSERAGAEVLEEYEVVLELPQGRRSHKGKARYVLKRERGALRFAAGLL